MNAYSFGERLEVLCFAVRNYLYVQRLAGCMNFILVLVFQNMLLEIEQKVVALSELSVHNDNLLLEGKAHTKEEAEQLAIKLRVLKGSLLELQRALHDKQLNIQVRAPATQCSILKHGRQGAFSQPRICKGRAVECTYLHTLWH